MSMPNTTIFEVLRSPKLSFESNDRLDNCCGKCILTTAPKIMSLNHETDSIMLNV